MCERDAAGSLRENNTDIKAEHINLKIVSHRREGKSGLALKVPEFKSSCSSAFY